MKSSIIQLILLISLSTGCKTTDSYYRGYYQELKTALPGNTEESLQCALSTLRAMQRKYDCQLLDTFKQTVGDCLKQHPETRSIWIDGVFGRCGR